MDHREYLRKLEDRLSRYFDVEQGFDFGGVHYDLYAKSLIRNEKYILSKKFTIYGFENNEYCLVKYYPDIDSQTLHSVIENLKAAVGQLVVPHKEHMSSAVTGVLVVDKVPSGQVMDTVRKFKYQKGFAFGFKGWADIKLIMVVLDSGEVFTNRKGRGMEKLCNI